MSFAEREQIAVRHAAGESIRAIARALRRAPTTVMRELDRNRSSRARTGYLASVAQVKAESRARRPKPTKLAGNPRLAVEVQTRLDAEHSPQQVAARLRVDFSDDEDMQISHETIYRELFVQGRGTLRRDLHTRLRTGRAVRRPRRPAGSRPADRGRIPNMVLIRDRPEHVADRSVPGNWEGDLIIGAGSASAIGTLVERATGFVLLLHLPGNHGADAVATVMIEQISRLPAALRRTLTWDQGIEMAQHARIAEATDLDIYFCDPHSPWQRAINENTNGLLRQYFPKSTDLSIYAPDYLDHVADKLNTRPRRRLEWKTPAEALDQLLSNPTNQAGVASTA